jgi:predicted MFS family arabinose efflux permease
MVEFIYAGIAVIIGLVLLFVFRKKWDKSRKINYVLILAFVLIILGLFFNSKPAIGYLFLALGAIIAIVERIQSQRKS